MDQIKVYIRSNHFPHSSNCPDYDTITRDICPHVAYFNNAMYDDVISDEDAFQLLFSRIERFSFSVRPVKIKIDYDDFIILIPNDDVINYMYFLSFSPHDDIPAIHFGTISFDRTIPTITAVKYAYISIMEWRHAWRHGELYSGDEEIEIVLDVS